MRRAGFWITLFSTAIIVYPFFPGLYNPMTVKSQAVSFISLLLIIAALSRVIRSGQLPGLPHRLYLFLTIFVVYVALRSLLSPFINPPGCSMLLQYLFSLALLVVLPILLFCNREEIESVKMGFLLGVTPAFIYTFLTIFRVDPLHLGCSMYGAYRVYGFFGHPTYLGGFLLLAIPLTLSMVLTTARRSFAVFAIILLVMEVTLLAFSQSRAAWVGFGVESILTLFFILKEGQFRKRLPIWPLLILFAVCAILLFNPVIYKRVLSFSIHDHTLQQRFYYWKAAGEMMKEAPLFGKGLHAFATLFPLVRDPAYLKLQPDRRILDLHVHNELLEMGAQEGVTGIAIFLIMCIILWIAALKMRGKTDAGRTIIPWAFVALIGFCVDSLASINFRVPSIAFFFWSIAAISLASAGPSRTYEHRYVKIAAVVLLIICIGSIPFIAVSALQNIKSQRLLRQGVDFVRQDDYRRGYGAFDKALRCNPDLVPALYDAGMALRKWIGGNSVSVWKLSRNLLKRAFALEPTYLDLPYQLARTELRTGLNEDAQRHLRVMLRIDPYHVDASFLYGVSALKTGHLVRAEKAFAQTLSLDPRHVAALLNLCSLKIHREEYADARHLLEDSLKWIKGKDRARVLIDLAILEMKSGHSDRSELRLRQAAELDAGNPAIPGIKTVLHR